MLGRAGAGKSGLLRAIAGLARLRAGTIRVFGDPPERPATRARLAYLPASFNPPGYLRGHDFVRLVLACHGGRVRRARTTLLAEQLGLDPELLNRPLRSCAKGVAQRLGVLAVLLTGRPLLVLDEPMRGLAPGARRLVKAQLAAGRRGRTLVLSSPIASDLEDLCDRIAIFRQGGCATSARPPICAPATALRPWRAPRWPRSGAPPRARPTPLSRCPLRPRPDRADGTHPPARSRRSRAPARHG